MFEASINFRKNAMTGSGKVTEPNKVRRDHDGSEGAGEPLTLGEAAYQNLRADIVAGALEAGKPLRLEALPPRYRPRLLPVPGTLMRAQSQPLGVFSAPPGIVVAPPSVQGNQERTPTP